MKYLPSVETASAYPYSRFERMFIQEIRQRRVIGTPAQVKERLLRLSEEYRADEILINSPIHDQQARIRSYELIAEAFGLTGS